MQTVLIDCVFGARWADNRGELRKEVFEESSELRRDYTIPDAPGMALVCLWITDEAFWRVSHVKIPRQLGHFPYGYCKITATNECRLMVESPSLERPHFEICGKRSRRWVSIWPSWLLSADSIRSDRPGNTNLNIYYLLRLSSACLTLARRPFALDRMNN